MPGPEKARAPGKAEETGLPSRSDGPALPVRLVPVLGALGAALADAGRWAEAESVLGEGLALASAPAWRVLRARLLAGRAELRLRTGDPGGALAGFREAVAIREAMGPDAALAGPYIGLARAYLLNGDRRQARSLFERALELDRAQGRRRAVVFDLITLARLEAPEPAALHLEEALVLAQRIGHAAGQALALGDLGALDVQAGAYARARERTSAAIELLRETGHRRDLALAHDNRAVAARELGDLPSALVDAELACDLYGQELPEPDGPAVGPAYGPGGDAATSDELGRSWAARVVGLGRSQDARRAAVRGRAVELAARLGRATSAWTHVERGKAETLAVHLERTPPSRPSGNSGPGGTFADGRGDAGWVEETREEVRSAGGRFGVEGEEGPGRSAGGRFGVEGEEGPGRSAGGRFGVEGEEGPGRSVGGPFGVDGESGPFGAELLEALVGTGVGAGAVTGLLGFFVGESGVTVLAHRSGWAEPRAFATAVGHDLLAEFAATVGGPRGGGSWGLGDAGDTWDARHQADTWRRLADLLLSDVLDALGDDLDVLYLIPHGDLHGLPLHALAPGGRLLLERFPVAYAPSATTLARLMRRRAPAGEGRSLVVAFSPEARERAAFEREAAAVADLLSTSEPAGARRPDGHDPRLSVRAAAVSGSLEGVWESVHLACRGMFDGIAPFDSGIRLADGLLTARRLMAMRIVADLVLLSSGDRSIHSGGSSRGGDYSGGGGRTGRAGVAALGHALLHAGARSALLPLWPVDAEVTRGLMLAFHARLREGTGRAAALREAVLESRQRYGSAQPELWAPYVLIGLAA